MQPTDAEVRAARKALGLDKKRDDKPTVDPAADRQAEYKRRERQVWAEANRPNTLKKFGLTRKDIANLLQNEALAEGLLPHEVRWLRDTGYQNVKLADLAKQLGVDLKGLDIILDRPIAIVVGNARARRIPIRHAPDDIDADGDFDKTVAAEEADINKDFAYGSDDNDDENTNTGASIRSAEE